MSSQTKTSSPVDMEQWRAWLLTSALIRKAGRWGIPSYGSTAIIHVRVGSDSWDCRSCLAFSTVFHYPLSIRGPGIEETNKDLICAVSTFYRKQISQCTLRLKDFHTEHSYYRDVCSTTWCNYPVESTLKMTCVDTRNCACILLQVTEMLVW